MPRGDGTGPRGTGAGTGRGLGSCRTKGAGETGMFGPPKDGSAGYSRGIQGPGPGSGGALRGRDTGTGVTIWDVLFSFLERITRK